MADEPRDRPGGTPACFLPTVDPAYLGYLTGTELATALDALRAQAQPVLDDAGALGAAPLAAAVAVLIAHLGPEPVKPAPAADASPARLAARGAALAAAIAALQPLIASDALHAVMRRTAEALASAPDGKHLAADPDTA